MGYIRHDAIIVTSWSDERIEEAAANAVAVGLQVLGPSEEATNGYRSILVCPDGSKEGWDESNDGELKRQRFMDWLDRKRHEDGSTPFEWAHVSYGSDDRDAAIKRHAWSFAAPQKETP